MGNLLSAGVYVLPGTTNVYILLIATSSLQTMTVIT